MSQVKATKSVYPILLLSFLITGCSTVERRGYFSPAVEEQNKSGPKKPTCGWANFGGLPDTYVRKESNNTLTITADQYFHPYLWGPWFASVIPVFPITWMTMPFTNDELDIRVEIKSLNETQQPSFSVTPAGDNTVVIEPASIKVDRHGDYTWYSVRFPIKYGNLDRFVLHVRSNSKDIASVDIPFVKATRWSWTQWTPNC